MITITGRLEPYEGASELNKWFVSERTPDDTFPGLNITLNLDQYQDLAIDPTPGFPYGAYVRAVSESGELIMSLTPSEDIQDRQADKDDADDEDEKDVKR
ncbi:MAG: hypothetical protein GIX03_12575 [Candidatus Eremiobacteraeota bacterium]|nr:hypothetical protein [Candidatus Eremiobacteraeota bacterium]MBC5825855.1 hypothetical protein [Candidatus Eremiobacteraeota bacterium]